MSKSTPGPWRVGALNDALFIYTRENEAIAAVHYPAGTGSFLTAEANASLIAAAPDLLEACKALLDIDSELHVAIKLAREAVAKAEAQ